MTELPNQMERELPFSPPRRSQPQLGSRESMTEPSSSTRTKANDLCSNESTIHELGANAIEKLTT